MSIKRRGGAWIEPIFNITELKFNIKDNILEKCRMFCYNDGLEGGFLKMIKKLA
jgi:hypothetical protein